MYLNTYVGTHEVFQGCHVDPTVATMMSTWMHDTDILGKMHYFQSLANDHSTKGLAHKGYTAEEACIAWCEEENRLHVMLQAKDSSSVDYNTVSPKDHTLIQIANKTDLQGLLDFWLIAYSIWKSLYGFAECILSTHCRAIGPIARKALMAC